MNRELLQIHVDEHTYMEDINPVLADNNDNIGMFYMPDVLGNQRFIRNDAGYPMSDVQRINQEADERIKASLLAELTDFTPSSNPNAGLSDADIMLSHRSKYCQTSTEMVSWLETQLHERDLRRQAEDLKASQTDDGKINFDGNENTES